MITLLRVMMQSLIEPTNAVGEAIIFSNQFPHNQDSRREGAETEKRNLEKVFVTTLKFEYLNGTSLNGDISRKLWDHNESDNPIKCQADNPSCIKCLIRFKANANTKYFLLAICSHGHTQDGDLLISLADDDQNEPSTKRKRVATCSQPCDDRMKLGDVIEFLKECEPLKTKTVIMIIETCRATSFIAANEDRGVPVLVAAGPCTNSTAEDDNDAQATVTNVRPDLPAAEQWTRRSQETDRWAVPVDLPKNYIILFGTTSFRVSYRHKTEGSWLEHALLQEMNQYVVKQLRIHVLSSCRPTVHPATFNLVTRLLAVGSTKRRWPRW
ncbi:uncharacterized protein LOC127831365 [Dreissena polymorpha]|uniref:uncharacterized protein LOC127831365 n=1 Tax=Dreissena polymorpha TaxID=45954 RepID=UPI002264B3BD|nr:uncharacterized protein LOC127831365 [Dreissena polymorpha]